VSLTLHLSAGARQTLSHHPHRRLRVLVRLRLSPKDGNPISTDVVVLMG
jgi:hypothetical protein